MYSLLRATWLTYVEREKAEQRSRRAEEKRILQEQNHEERKVRTEQKALAPTGGAETGRSRFLPPFLRGGVAGGAATGTATATTAEGTADAVAGGATAVTSLSTGTETATGLYEPGGLTVHEKVTLGTTEPMYGQVTMDSGDATDDQATMDLGEVTRGQGTIVEDESARAQVTTVPEKAVHDQVTMDPSEAAFAVAAADDEEGPKPTEVPLPGDEDVGPTDKIGAPAYSGTSPPQKATLATSATSPSKRNSRVKSFFKRLKTGSKAENDYIPDQPAAAETKPKETVAEAGRTAEPIEEEDLAATDSIRDVAFAGRSDNETEDMYGGSVKPEGRVSPIRDDEVSRHADYRHGPSVTEGGTQKRDISPPSTSSPSEDPYVIAADVASSRYSTEKDTGSKRNSGYDPLANVADDEEETRGRKGFRERFMKKVMPGRDKDKRQPGTFTSSGVGTSAAAQITATAAASAYNAVTEDTPHAEPGATEPAKDGESQAHDADEQDLAHEKTQEPSTTSTEATGNTTITGATTPALTNTQTNDNEDDDFEEARDTFDEGPMVKASQVDSGSARIGDVNSPTSKGRASGEGSRFTEEL